MTAICRPSGSGQAVEDNAAGQVHCTIEALLASPVVLVREKTVVIDFVFKADTFLLPRIVDLLDQLGKSKYFTTLDMASGYWQIHVHPEPQEKTAFVTSQGLCKFHVMPFGLCNAPAVFQLLNLART